MAGELIDEEIACSTEHVENRWRVSDEVTDVLQGANIEERVWPVGFVLTGFFYLGNNCKKVFRLHNSSGHIIIRL